MTTYLRPEPPSHSNGRVVLDAALLKSLRHARGWSQEALANLCFDLHLPVSIASVKRAETSNAVLYRTARHLATMYDVKVDALVLRSPLAHAPAPSSGTELSPTPGLEHAAIDGPPRYVVQLHVELAAPPDRNGDTVAAIGTYGGQVDCIAGMHVTCIFGLPAAIDERSAPRTALVGRTAQVREFDAVLEMARANGNGQLVYLRGTAGVGKSRLAQAYAQRSRAAGFRCHTAQVQDIGTNSWRAPLEQLTRSLFEMSGRAPSADDDTIDEAIAALRLPVDWSLFYRALAGVRMTSRQMSVYGAMSHSMREQGMASALGTLILRLAQCGPLLLTIEDVHWGGGSLFEALGGLLPLSREAPLVWVLTSRREHDPLEASLRPHLFDLPVAVFDLAPLAPHDSLALAARYADLDDAYRRSCVERAQGNPLFLTQLLANPT